MRCFVLCSSVTGPDRPIESPRWHQTIHSITYKNPSRCSPSSASKPCSSSPTKSTLGRARRHTSALYSSERALNGCIVACPCPTLACQLVFTHLPCKPFNYTEPRGYSRTTRSCSTTSRATSKVGSRVQSVVDSCVCWCWMLDNSMLACVCALIHIQMTDVRALGCSACLVQRHEGLSWRALEEGACTHRSGKPMGFSISFRRI